MTITKLSPKNKLELKLFMNPVKAGFPSPADDFVEKELDLNKFLIKHPASTYFVKVEGSSMKNAGISTGDILIVDKALEPKNNAIVIASVDNEFTVKRVSKIKDALFLIAENEDFEPIKINPEDDFQIFGVVTNVIKQLN